MIWTLKELQDTNQPITCINNKWVPCRPENWKHRSLKQKIKESWSVFKGDSEPFKWPENQ